FSTWAGPVTLVVGGEYREQELDQSSNADPTIPLDLKGLRGVPPFVQQYNIVNVGTAKGKLRVKEAFMETLVPLIANKPLIESLDFNGAVRYTDYSVSGGVTTWKTGLIWNLNEELTIRSALSRDIRAPSLYEFFSGSQQGQRIFLDPHTGTVSVAATDSSGNLELQPEEGTTKTLGFIYQPSWMDGLGISFDYYDIEIEDAILAPDVVDNVIACEASNGTSPVCDFVVRPLPYSDTSPANFPLVIKTQPINTATLTQKGYDLEINYEFPADVFNNNWPGTFEIRGLANYVPEQETLVAKGQPAQKRAGYFLNPR